MAANNVECDFDRSLQKALDILAERGFSRSLREEQEISIRQLWLGGDLLAVLPTGYGKSLIFRLLVLSKNDGFAFVICPLKSIVKDQLLEASSMGISAGSLPESTLEDVESGKYQLLFASAEDALSKEFLASLKKKNSAFHRNLCAVVIDECHTVEIWTGRRSNSKVATAFRESFGKLATLRSHCKEGTPVAGLTGTADANTQKAIKDSLHLKADVKCVYVGPNRRNLRFSVRKVKKEKQLEELQWLIDLTKEKGLETPKTIIFCNTMNEIASIVNYLLRKLDHDAYSKQLKKPENCYIGVYHSNSWQVSKERITNSLKGNGVKRIIVATTALCMGVNFPDIRNIIIWGAARSILDLHQEAGRAGRDGLQSHIIVIYHGQEIGPCEKEVKDFVRSNGCLRVAAYQSLDGSIEPLSPMHDCCSYCSTMCKCGEHSCEVAVLPFEAPVLTTDEVCITNAQREVTLEESEELKNALMEVFQELKVWGLSIDDSASHGFSKELIEDVVKNCAGIFTIEDVLDTFPVFSVENAMKILEVIQECFQDIPNLEQTLSLFRFGSNVYSNTWFEIEDSLFSDDENDQLEDAGLYL